MDQSSNITIGHTGALPGSTRSSKRTREFVPPDLESQLKRPRGLVARTNSTQTEPEEDLPILAPVFPPPPPPHKYDYGYILFAAYTYTSTSAYRSRWLSFTASISSRIPPTHCRPPISHGIKNIWW